MSKRFRSELASLDKLPNTCLDEVSIDNVEVVKALCYPFEKGSTRVCIERVERLLSTGIDVVCSWGLSELPGSRLRVLGKGHSSVVLSAFSNKLGLVAIKVRRLDSKRQSLVQEALLLREASMTGASPHVYYYDDDMIVMDAVLGPSLEKRIRENGLTERTLEEVLDTVRALDVAKILHLELSRPWRNLVFTCESPWCKALVIDLESAKRGCGNLLLVLGGLASISSQLMSIVAELRDNLREYLKSECSKKNYEEIKKAMLEVVKGKKLDLNLN
ncbi:MAG: hypothetical protein QXP64_04340 [Acidilobaceae archaeon]